MLPATTKKGGMCIAVPDTCKTPAAPSPIPMPYPNMGQVNTATDVVAKVLVENKETVVESSKLPSSNGDEAGTVGGVVSGTFGKDVTFKQSSSKVFFQGKKAVTLTAVTAHNGSNANAPAGCHVAPSQTKVLVAP
jgi:hypothetical protein